MTSTFDTIMLSGYWYYMGGAVQANGLDLVTGVFLALGAIGTFISITEDS